MCGIAGKICWTKRPSADVARAMSDAMKSRGPDAEGIYSSEQCVLGHRRLSIIDLSDSARQPMADADARYQLVFNGEIYNFSYLKKKLIAYGAEFRTNSDSEVIIEAYKKWGPDCLNRFNGMFAFAIWDDREKSLFLARDRLGKKPLYYYLTGDGGIIFASDLRALLKDSEIPVKLDPKAISQYLSLGYILSDCSIISGVRKLPAAHFMTVRRNEPSAPVRYWNIRDSFLSKQSITENDAAEALRLLLKDACKLRLVSDVPLGAFLSGGLDSSAVVASMTQLRTSIAIKTFSIGFDEPTFSELSQARAAADFLQVTHSSKTVGADALEIFHRIIQAAGEPFADNSMIPMYYLSEFTKSHVTVALSGDGGDELFAGYETYLADRMHRIAARVPKAAVRVFQRLSEALVPVTFDKVSFDYKLHRFLNGAALSPQRAHYSWREFFSTEEKHALLQPKHAGEVMAHDPFNRFEELFSEVRDCHYLDQAMYVDIHTWLVDDILVKADRMSMAHSLELRCPYLDYRLVEFAASLPVSYKLRGLEKKYILKKSQEKQLPRDTVYRSKKGFNAPVSHWLHNGWGKELNRALLGGGPILDFVEPAAVKKLIEDHHAKRADNGYKLFNLLSLAVWMEQVLR